MVAITTLTTMTTLPALADTVIVESRTGAAVTGNPPYLDAAGNWASSSAKSAAPGTTSTRGGCRFNTLLTGPPSFTITPTLGTAGGHYFVEVSHASGGNASSIITDLIMSIATVGGSGLPATTDGFNQANGQSVWYRIGTIDLDTGVNNPAITFTYSSGTPAGAALRIVADAFRFVNTNDLCLGGLPQLTTVNGPLAAGQTFVIVPNVNAAATNVSVYADGVKIGQLNSGVVAGVNTVPTSALIQNQDITATQRSNNGIDSCPSTIGPNVGGGANPRIRVALSIRDNSPTGPIGSNGGVTGVHFVYMKATGTVAGGFGNASTGGTGNVLTPSTCWQTLTFNKATDDLFGWAGPYALNTLPDGLACIDSIAFAIDDLTDTGPFQIYIDNIVNGSTIIQDFETSTAGDVASTINLPSFAGSTSAFLLSPAPGTITPDVSTIVNTNADSGTNCLVLNWQFKDTAAADWLRATFQGVGTGSKPNPIVDLTQPISIRFLVLPVGKGTNCLTLTSVPQSQCKNPGQSVTFSVTASGVGLFTYQWKTNGVDIAGATSSSYTIPSVSTSDALVYTVGVTAAGCVCSTESNPAVLTVNPLPGAMTVSRSGTDVVLDWAGSFVLQSASAVTGPYTDVAGPVTTGPYTTSASGDAMFFRLRAAGCP